MSTVLNLLNCTLLFPETTIYILKDFYGIVFTEAEAFSENNSIKILPIPNPSSNTTSIIEWLKLCLN